MNSLLKGLAAGAGGGVGWCGGGHTEWAEIYKRMPWIIINNNKGGNFCSSRLPHNVAIKELDFRQNELKFQKNDSDYWQIELDFSV